MSGFRAFVTGLTSHAAWFHSHSPPVQLLSVLPLICSDELSLASTAAPRHFSMVQSSSSTEASCKMRKRRGGGGFSQRRGGGMSFLGGGMLLCSSTEASCRIRKWGGGSGGWWAAV